MTIKSAFPNGHFYSPVVDTADLRRREAEIFQAQPIAHGIDFNEASHSALIDSALAPYMPDFDYPETGTADAELSHYYNQNDQFSWLDSRALFCFLRHWQPRRIVEVGSGYSSLLMADVKRRFLSPSTVLQCVEPYPRPFLRRTDLGFELVEKRAQDIPLAFFSSLDAGDLLFIDSSHVCKTGSDVNYLFLTVLPQLKPGVRIHVHDIFLPFEYPRVWVIDENRSWNEQYLLHALHMFSSGFRVLFANSFAFYRFPTQIVRALNNPDGSGYGGGSVYIERC